LQQADIGIGSLALTSGRVAVVDYLIAYNIQTFTFSVPPLKHRLYVDLTEMFDSTTWILLLISIMILFAIINCY